MSLDTRQGHDIGPLAFLRRFARPRANRERCELCAVELADSHAHLIDPTARRLICACDACSILFGHQGAATYRRIPRRIDSLTDFQLTELQWQGLGLPVNLAFFLHSTPVGRIVAVYPSPGGATEAAVDPETWQDLIEQNPILRDLEPDTEALLANRVDQTRDHYRVGIDECYKLVGVVRTHWRGFTGGAVWQEIGRFFEDLKERSRPVRGCHA